MFLRKPDVEWSPDEESKLKELVENGLTAGQIAKLTNGRRSRNAIIGKIKRLGLKLKGADPFARNKNASAASPPKPKTPKVKKERKVYSTRLLSPETFAEYSPTKPPIPIHELTKDTCRFIMGETKLYCGQQVHTGSYCAFHAKLTTMKWEKDKRRILPWSGGFYNTQRK